MKTFIAISISMMLAVSFSVNAGSQGHAMVDGHDGQRSGGMGDHHARSMMMDQIVDDPEMRQEMTHKLMQSMDMEKMMNNPEMKTRMQKHVGMMQAMLDSEGLDQAKMQMMMDNPEMMSMMKMHMMCAQTASGELLGKHSMDHNEDHVQ